MLFTLFLKGHVTNITQASLTSRWLRYVKAIRNNPALAYTIWNARVEGHRRLSGKGPAEALDRARNRLRFDWEGVDCVRIGCELINLFSCNTEKFAHQLRDLGRNMVWSQVRSDARRLKREPGEIPHLVDVGENGGVDRKRSLLFHDKLYIGGDKTIMRIILCNGVWTTRARSRLPQNAGLSSVCPFCDMNVPGDILHMWWFCPIWLAVREKFFDCDLEDRLMECFDDLPQAFKTCGVVNNNCICTALDDEFMLATHGMMFTNFQERALRQKEREGVG